MWAKLTSAALVLSVANASPTKRVAGLQPAKHVLDMKKIAGSTASSRLILPERLAVGTTPFVLAAEGLAYAVDILFGEESFSVLFDTGSSDLWLPTANFSCVDRFHEPVSQEECEFGPGFSGSFSGGPIPDQNFNITYGDGEFLTGTLGYQDVTLAGVTVEKQEVALVDYGYWFGDGTVSGLIGFAYPLLTSAYSGIDPTVDNPNTTAVNYQPFFFNAFQSGLIPPVFSLALLRSSSPDGSDGGGQLALGGLPTLDFTPDFTTTRLEIYPYNSLPQAATQFSYYTICPDGFVYSAATSPNATANATSDAGVSKFLKLHDLHNANSARDTLPSVPVIVDSGTTLNYLPAASAAAINRAFSPPSRFSTLYGLWINDDCDAVPPNFAVRINGTDFAVNPADMLITPGGSAPGTRDFCVSGVQQSSRISILGDVWLKNVVAVFDLGGDEVSFAAHVDY